MQLPVEIFRYKLEKHYGIIESNIIKDASYPMINKICFFDKDYPIEKNTLYLISEIEEFNNIKNSEIAILFCNNKSFNLDVPYLHLNSNIDLFKVSNEVHDIFNCYQLWEKNLQKALQEENLQEIVDCSIPFFENEISIIDANYRLMIQKPSSKYPEGFIPKDIMDFFKNDKLFNQVRVKKEAFIYPASIFKDNCWCKNIFYQNEYYCRIVIHEENPFPACMDYLINFLSKYVDFYIKQYHSQYNTKQKQTSLENYLRKILSQEEISLQNFQQSLTSYGWYPNEYYLCGYLLLSQGDFYNKTIHYYCKQLMRDYPSMCAFEYDNQIVFIINCSKYDNSVSKFMSKFSYTMREGNFRLGLSNIFQDFDNLKYYYKQAQIAILTGIQEDDSIWSYKFCDEAIPYILQQASKDLSSKFLCAKELLILQEYDRKNQTNYYETLKIYLETNCNAVQTAKKLYIHYATMVYRLKRLKEIANIDFKDIKKILYFQLSLYLLEK